MATGMLHFRLSSFLKVVATMHAPSWWLQGAALADEAPICPFGRSCPALSHSSRLVGDTWAFRLCALPQGTAVIAVAASKHVAAF